MWKGLYGWVKSRGSDMTVPSKGFFERGDRPNAQCNLIRKVEGDTHQRIIVAHDVDVTERRKTLQGIETDVLLLFQVQTHVASQDELQELEFMIVILANSADHVGIQCVGLKNELPERQLVGVGVMIIRIKLLSHHDDYSRG